LKHNDQLAKAILKILATVEINDIMNLVQKKIISTEDQKFIQVEVADTMTINETLEVRSLENITDIYTFEMISGF